MTVQKESLGADTATIMPGGELTGEIAVPGDKSVSHRAVILGSIADGKTEVSGFLEGEDNLSTMAAFEAMGVRMEKPGPGKLLIHGVGMEGLKEPCDVINAGNSGTTARLLIGLLSAQPFFTVITGDESLRKRPMKRVVTPLTEMGARIYGRKDSSLLPLAITGDKLKGITYTTPVASAQLKSAILLAGLYAEGETTVAEPAVSRDHTERMLELFGAKITKVNGKTVHVRSTKGLNRVKIKVPGDISSAAFFMVGAAITASSDLVIRDVGINPTRTGILHILQKMGAEVDLQNPRESSGEPVADIRVRSSELKGTDIGGAELLLAIDEFPIICVAAAFAEGTTRITGAGELRVKESDRISAMAELLSSIGVEVEEKPDGIIIEGLGKDVSARGGVTVPSHGDHRIAMATAITALRCTKPLTIDGASSIDVSFPCFLELLDQTRWA